MDQKIRITHQDLTSPQVEEAIARENAIRAAAANMRKVGFFRKFFFSSVFYLAIFGGIGAFVGWAIMEPVFEDLTTISGPITQFVDGETIGYCKKCNGGINANANKPESHKCPSCGGPLKLAESVTAIKLERTTVFLLMGRTNVATAGGREKLTSFDQLRDLKTIRVKGAILFADQKNKERQTLLGVTIEPNVALPGGKGDEPDLWDLNRKSERAGLFLFAVIAGFIGLMIGAIEGIASLNLRLALWCGLIGLAIGFAGGMVGLIPGGAVYTVGQMVSDKLAGESKAFGIEEMHGGALFSQIVARSLAWGVIGLAIAMGQGIARKSKKLIINGLIGGCLGGLVGGLLFDPIAKFIGGGGAEISRCVGFVSIGVLVGIFLGLVEQLSKEAWVLMRTGPLAGKQFVVYKSETSIGGSSHCDIYLFRDASVDPEHARLVRVGRTFEITTATGRQKLLVNNVPVQRRILQDGDVITIGATQLEYRARIV